MISAASPYELYMSSTFNVPMRLTPIKNVAESLKLPVHERGSFEGWEGSWDHALHPVNLIIAVSFGLLIPREVLRSAAYGGLNLHPSLLPEFRGAAPLHHILLSGRRHIGVSLQTLHPTRFDHGTVLAQTPYPGDEIPSPDTCTVQELKDFVAPKGAAMLVRGICEKLFLPPVQDVSWWKGDRSSDGAKSFPRAPKVTPQDSQVAWSTWTAAEILRRQRVLGPLWTQVKERDGETGTRVIMHGLQEAPRLRAPTWKTGHFYLAKADTLPRLLLRTCDERVLSVDQITVEGRPRMDAVAAAHRYRELLAHESEHGSLEETGRD
ncbi:MAG: Methionyl-tRNA formyltransferase [Thelocarpon superellum]|nr:MAG: Methionyl-tRNA formyltransferase [Thelocarpon superellum]